MSTLAARLGLALPIVQAPMAGVSTPAMAAAAAEAGALGSLPFGMTGAAGAAAMIADLRARTSRPFAVNLFVHAPPRADAAIEATWIERWRPLFTKYGAAAPDRLQPVNTSFAEDDAMLALLLAQRPAVASFHFGLPDAARIAALRTAGIMMLATVTSLAEALAARAAGMDALVAQGWEAGGHRGVFDPGADDDRLGTLALVRVLTRRIDLPVIAAGGIMDGAGIDAARAVGAVAAQLGTAFIACDESLADAAYRAALTGEAAHHTRMTATISGRPARCLANRFTAAKIAPHERIPAYPIAYDLGKALNAAAKARGESGFGAQWAGQGAPLARAMPTAALIRTLAAEMRG